MSEVRQLVIIGSGPAGYTAGIYASRAQLQPLLLAGETSGGQLMNTTLVENWPGSKEGIMGPELMMEMRTQAERFGTEIVDSFVTAVDFSTKPFKIWTRPPTGLSTLDFITKATPDEIETAITEIKQHQPAYEANSVIISTGARSKLTGAIGESKLMGRGVAVCAVCDAAFYRDKKTFVVGGGDAAVEDALALTKFASKVIMLVRGEEMKASKIMADRALNHSKIEVWYSTKLKEIKGEQKVESIVISNDQGEFEHPADGVFIAIGHIPVTEIFRNQLELDPKGFLVTHLNSTQQLVPEDIWLHNYPTQTSVSGVFGAGDVVDFRYRQAITSAGFGCMAALDAERYLEH